MRRSMDHNDKAALKTLSRKQWALVRSLEADPPTVLVAMRLEIARAVAAGLASLVEKENDNETK